MAGAYIGFFTIIGDAEHRAARNAAAAGAAADDATGVIASVVVAVLLERIAYRPLRNAPRLVPLITAIGASIALQQLFLRLFGASTRRYPDVHFYVLPQPVPESGMHDRRRRAGLPGHRPDRRALRRERSSACNCASCRSTFVVFFLALVFMSMLWFYVQRTKTGKAMRAVAEDKATAALMGINVDRVIVTTFVLGAALAGAGGVLFALYNQQVSPFIGFIPGLKAFTAAVLGGIGNIPGAMFGGLFLGIIESVAPSLLGLSQQLKDVIAFGMLVLVLIFRPTGHFRRSAGDKEGRSR